MMGENKSLSLHSDNESDGCVVANKLGDRGFPLVSRSPITKRLSGSKRAAENLVDDAHFWKQVSLTVEKLQNELRGVWKCPKVEPNEVRPSSMKGDEGGLIDGSGGTRDREAVVEIKKGFVSTLDSIDIVRSRDLRKVDNVDVMAKEGVFLNEICEKDCIGVENDCQEGEEMRGLSDIRESDCSPEALGTQILSDNSKSVGELAEMSRFTESQETRSFGLERCVLLKGDGSNSLAAGMDLLQNCSCSFCSKAAYIWSDLQCQDVNGRLSILTVSQKEASDLARTYSVETALGSSMAAPHLESDLTTLWKSLFQDMENNFAAESSQLQSNLAVLKDIKEDYRLNLEMINVMPPETQQCLSDASEI